MLEQPRGENTMALEPATSELLKFPVSIFQTATSICGN